LGLHPFAILVFSQKKPPLRALPSNDEPSGFGGGVGVSRRINEYAAARAGNTGYCLHEAVQSLLLNQRWTNQYRNAINGGLKHE
jgi:hypothetical protein